MSEKFKIGDHVRRINQSHGNFNIGDIGIIIGFKSIGNRENILLRNDRFSYSHGKYNLIRLGRTNPNNGIIIKV